MFSEQVYCITESGVEPFAGVKEGHACLVRPLMNMIITKNRILSYLMD